MPAAHMCAVVSAPLANRRDLVVPVAPVRPDRQRASYPAAPRARARARGTFLLGGRRLGLACLLPVGRRSLAALRRAGPAVPCSVITKARGARCGCGEASHRDTARRLAFARGVAGNTAWSAQVLWDERQQRWERFTRATYCTRGVTPRTGYHAEGERQHLRASPTAL